MVVIVFQCLPHLWASIWDQYFFAWKTIFGIYFNKGVLLIYSVSDCLKNVLFLPSLSKAILSEYRFLGWLLISFSNFILSFYCLASIFFFCREVGNFLICYHIESNIFDLYIRCYLSLVFSGFTLRCPSVCVCVFSLVEVHSFWFLF